jgi:hypothetical protein
MAWKKLGMIFDLSQHKIDWIKSHAMLPSPLVLDDRIRVYFTGRDGNNHSRISFVDLKREDPTKILYVHDRPLLEVGKLGTFDDSGTLGTFAVRNGNEIYLYYNGYNMRVTVPWSNAIGLAISRDDGVTFERAFEGPIADRNTVEPYFVITPCIIRENNLWHIWYTSGTGWVVIGERPEPLYIIKYAQSTDGIVWKRENVTCIQPLSLEEANARAAVVKDGDRYKMWFIYRGSKDFRDGVDSYRIGYAEADDPINWKRDDAKAGITLSTEGWDSKMQAYPAVITVDGNRYLFYNGNGFGVAGFGCAVWE